MRKHTTEKMTWFNMLARCYNPKNPGYSKYGGRGIKVCDRWDTYDNFLTDMGTKPSEALSLDRINNDGDYSPENCKWSTVREQNNNTGMFSTNTSGIKGVSYSARDRTWRAYGHGNFGQIHLGTARNLFEAACLRKAWENNSLRGVI